MLSVDLTSDLHIDQWDPTLENKYPCGVIKNYPIQWEGKIKSKILIVAGDISDQLEFSLDYLDQISKYYDKVLFIDGNHEHVHRYPELIHPSEILNNISLKKNPKLVYLPLNPYEKDGVIFIGACGWWDYFDSPELVEQDMKYFENWRGDLGIPEGKRFIDNIVSRGQEEIDRLREMIEFYDTIDHIKTIVVVTHTVPEVEFSNHVRTEVNGKYQSLMDLSPKVKYWFFGHTHQKINEQKPESNLKFITNPRGRPEDYDREEYSPLQVQISKL